MDSLEGPRRPENYDVVLADLKEKKALRRSPGGGSLHLYMSMIAEFQDMANGGNPDGIRTEYYPDWSDTDFADLLRDAGESVDLERGSGDSRGYNEMMVDLDRFKKSLENGGRNV